MKLRDIPNDRPRYFDVDLTEHDHVDDGIIRVNRGLSASLVLQELDVRVYVRGLSLDDDIDHYLHGFFAMLSEIR